MPESSAEAKAAVAQAVEVGDPAWQAHGDQAVRWISRTLTLPQGAERWLVVRTSAGEARARASLWRHVDAEQARWQRTLWHLSHRAFACEADAQAVFVRTAKDLPAWLRINGQVVAQPRYAQRGRPAKAVVPATVVWQVHAQVATDAEAVEREVLRRACFLVATNVLDAEELADKEVIHAYIQEQRGVERGFAFLKDPLFLASSVFLKKPERIVALSLVMVLCLLVYRLAEYRLRQQLAASGQTIPNQINKPTQRPTMRWVFQCFEGIDRLTIPTPTGPAVLILHLTLLHDQILTLLGPAYRRTYHLTN